MTDTEDDEEINCGRCADMCPPLAPGDVWRCPYCDAEWQGEDDD